ncbi:hypothetical protein D918_09470, partial [Trichuris suis]
LLSLFLPVTLLKHALEALSQFPIQSEEHTFQSQTQTSLELRQTKVVHGSGHANMKKPSKRLRLISLNSILAQYDADRPSAVEKPQMHPIREPSPAERSYAQNNKEALSITFMDAEYGAQATVYRPVQQIGNADALIASAWKYRGHTTAVRSSPSKTHAPPAHHP